VGFTDAWVVLLQAQTAAVQDLASQLSDSTRVNSRQEAGLSAKEAQVQRLNGKLSEQQAQVHQLQTLASEKECEVERLTAVLAEKQKDQQGQLEKFANRLRSIQQELSAEQQERASAALAHSADAQVGNNLACCLVDVVTCDCPSQLISWHIC